MRFVAFPDGSVLADSALHIDRASGRGSVNARQ
jgi:hypothetical protein